MISKIDIDIAKRALDKLPMCESYLILLGFIDKVNKEVVKDKKIPALLRDYHEQH